MLTCMQRKVRICQHSSVTRFTQHREERCKEQFSKTCHITFSRQAREQVRERCFTPVVKECGEDKEDKIDTCEEVFDTDCVTVYDKDDGREAVIPKTECQRLPRTLCGSGRCKSIAGAMKCHNHTTTILNTQSYSTIGV